MPKPDRPLSKLGLAFARSLIRDIATLGYGVKVVKGVPRYSCLPVEGGNRAFYRDAHLRLHAAQLLERRDRIRTLEAEIGSGFIEGQALDLALVRPRLRPVDLRKESGATARDRAIIEYIRSYQTVGSKMSVGRENAFILEDEGQRSTALMGALVLASPRYFQPRRDEVLGWPTPSRLGAMGAKDQARYRAIRGAGLTRMMHVAICCALPPYSQLGAARLLAVAPFTAQVRDAFDARWRDKDGDPDLALVTTTSSMGRTGTPFQDLRAALFFDPTITPARGEKWNRNARLYARLSEVHPWQPNRVLSAREAFANFRALVSARTRALAAAFIAHEAPEQNDPDKILDRAIRRVGLTHQVFRGNPIGVYLGAVDRESIAAVAAGVPRNPRPIMSWDLAVRKFRRDFGAELDPERKMGADKEKRAAAITARRARACAVTMADICLSQRLSGGLAEAIEAEAAEPD